jgi:predicted house-cleaning noncanonical NTP pyrophosphatase (MazG superfamily)
MFVLDTFLGWILNTVAKAAEAEMNDDTALREQLLEAEMRREMGEISDDEFAEIEADLLERIRDIKERREGGSGPIAFGEEPTQTASGSRLQVEATVSGDFHERAERVERAEPIESDEPTPGRPSPARRRKIRKS